jgi:AraC family transcriptional regulator
MLSCHFEVNMIVPQIVKSKEKFLVGLFKNMSLVENQTLQLWSEFRPQVNTIANRLGTDFFSMQNYPQNYFTHFDPITQFEKWAAVEVPDLQYVPANMKSLTLIPGLYAVFHYVGSSTDTKIFQFIYQQWLPQSEFLLDERPHFEVLGDKYKNNDPNSEEHIWIPVRRKSV